MLIRRVFVGSLIVLAAGLAGACATRKASPDTNAPSSAPAEGAPPAPYGQPGQPGYQSAPTGTMAPPPGDGSGLVPKTAAEDRPAYATLADAEQAFAQAKSELEGLTGAQKPKEKASSTAGPPGGQLPAAKPDANLGPLAQGDPRCERACKAFASMRRAADGVCRLAGDGDARCTRARGVVKENETRVAACRCDAGG